MSKTSIDTRVWAVYYFKAETSFEVLNKVHAQFQEEVLDNEEQGSLYFGLSTEDCDDCQGSHFSDDEWTFELGLEKKGLYRLVIEGCACGLENPYITPPVLYLLEPVDKKGKESTDGDAADFGSYVVDSMSRETGFLPPSRIGSTLPLACG